MKLILCHCPTSHFASCNLGHQGSCKEWKYAMLLNRAADKNFAEIFTAVCDSGCQSKDHYTETCLSSFVNSSIPFSASLCFLAIPFLCFCVSPSQNLGTK
uniref:Uncharacterized protein n=1 Tax=Opuntia streptacantha TaxID=393608 RepID=A0A7C9DHE7_OPUST